jgi:clathrin heavy chain
MASSNLPIVFSEKLNLQQLGINANFIRFGFLTMESDKFICVRQENQGKGSISIVDMQAGNSISTHAIQADNAIMNPVTKVLALRAGQTLQIFNIEMKAKMKSFNMPSNQTVQFWRWVNHNTIAIVTNSHCYHWSVDGQSDPVMMFERHGSLASSQIINYQASEDMKWLLVVGIAKQENQIVGNMQLYSVEKKVSQKLDGHAGTFASMAVNGETEKRNVFCFCEKKLGQAPRLFVMEVGRDPSAGASYKINPQAVPFPQDIMTSDFPVSLAYGPKYGVLYMITKMGYLYLFDAHTGVSLFQNRISADTIFVSCASAESGVLGVTANKGQVLSVSINESTMVPYIVQSLGNAGLAIAMAARGNLPGAEQLYQQQFEMVFSQGNLQEAARLAADSPQGILRNPQTIQRFQQVQPQPNMPQPVLIYFQTLLQRGKLNASESVELARPVLQQGRGQLLEKWLSQDKLECSEQLGDMVVGFDAKMALSIYLRANVTEKVIQCFLQQGAYDKIVAYAKKVGYQPDFIFMLQNIVRQNPKGAEEFAKMLVGNDGGNPLVDVNMVVEVFMQMNCIQECTSFLLDALKANKPEEGPLQTRLLEINLLGGAPQVADAIFQSDMFSHYDKPRIAGLCEKAGLFQRALEHYSDINDIKRVMQNTNMIKPEFLVNFFGNMTSENCFACLNQLMNNPANKQVVVQICTKYTEQLTATALIEMLEEFKAFDAIFYYLGGIVNSSEDPEVHFKYIEAAAKVNQLKEVERVCRDSTVYDAEKVKDFLMDAKMADPRPLIHVCDRHDFISELTSYLYSNNLMKYIEVYVQKVSPQKTPQVVGKLLDLDANEDFIRGLLNSVRNMCPVDPLVEECERRNRLRLLQPWLEARIAEGNTETPTHNAIGKLYIRLNKDPQQFLLYNQFYDSKVVGAFCEKLDPYLAYLAYKRAGGTCDDELIAVTNKNMLWKDQARYIVGKMDLELWGKVLADDNEHKEQLIQEVKDTALPESQNPDEVSTTVKAFMNASIPEELIGLLEKIVLHGSEFSQNNNLQNLLIITSMQSQPEKVRDYIERLDHFDGPQIATIARGEEYNLFEEAFLIYKKFDLHTDAVDVLLNQIHSLDRGFEYADRVNQPEVWMLLGRAQIQSETPMVKEAVASFLKADDATEYKAVIEVAEANSNWEDLKNFLVMARSQVKERLVDSELIMCYAMIDDLANLEEFLSTPNAADIQNVGDRLFEQEMYKAAKLLFKNISNNAMLAACHIHLTEFREAVEAARSANSVKTWKVVNKACLTAGEFKLAATCGLKIIINPDHIDELIIHYERLGHYTEVIELLEQGLGLENAHTGIFTELGCMYSKYSPDKLMEHIKIFWTRINIPKLLRACEEGGHWSEATFLYSENKEFDNAVRCMIDHSPVAYNHDRFMICVNKVRNSELYYQAINFYVQEQPLQLHKLLTMLASKLDHARVVHQMRKSQNISLVFPYLRSVQKENLTAVNEAINDTLVEEEKYEELRESIDSHDNFDQIALAQKIEKHELLEFRRIAAYLYKKNKRYKESVALSKEDKMYKDAIDTCAESGDAAITEDLLNYFVVDAKDKECFAATLYTCYDLVKPDVALELAWRHGLTDFAMPFMIQTIRSMSDKIKELDERTKPPEDAQNLEEQAMAAAAQQGIYGMGNGAPLQLAATAYNDGGMGMMNQGMGMGQMNGGMMNQGQMGMQMNQSMGMNQMGMNQGF